MEQALWFNIQVYLCNVNNYSIFIFLELFVC